MPTRTTREDGDIVVRQEKREGRFIYILHTATSEDQYLLRSREEAIAQAVAFAKWQCVRTWMTNSNYDFALLEDFRVVASI